MADMIYIGSTLLATLLFTALQFVHPPDSFEIIICAVFFIEVYRDIEPKFYVLSIYSLTFSHDTSLSLLNCFQNDSPSFHKIMFYSIEYDALTAFHA